MWPETIGRRLDSNPSMEAIRLCFPLIRVVYASLLHVPVDDTEGLVLIDVIHVRALDRVPNA